MIGTSEPARADDARPGGGWRELAAVLLVAGVLAAVFTWPLAWKLGSVARLDNDDARFGVWNVAWVARTVVADPLNLYNANIFYPHPDTLAYSETNVGAGLLATPAYWLTRNPYFAHNFVVLLSFVLSAAGGYYLVRYLTRDRRAAIVSGICFGFSPYAFSWTAEIQLLMTFGLPFTMLAFHRAADRPTPGRGAALGAVMALEAAFCGYYGVFLMLMVGFATFVVAATRRRWTDRAYWTCIAIAALTAVALVVPLFLPYMKLQRVTGFARSLADARRFSADWRGYLASPAVAHRWLLHAIGSWRAVAFPGYIATGFGVAGAWLAWKSREREVLAIYGGLAVLAFWASLGPEAGLYTLFYRTLPIFAWLRAPGRFSVIVLLGLAVLASFAVRQLLASATRPAVVLAAILLVGCAESITPMRWREVPPVPAAYRVLATLPPGAVIELPFYARKMEIFGHVKYMLWSTSHWKPLVNGYSDYIPPDFYENVLTLAPFPSLPAFKLLEPGRVRYAMFHMDLYNDRNRAETFERLAQFAPYLRPMYVDDTMRLYEIVDYPRQP